MDRDRFSIVKAHLDREAKDMSDEIERYQKSVNALRAALTEIAAIQHQSTDLGCRIAVGIAKEALEESDWP
jgi:hypothetical protein